MRLSRLLAGGAVLTVVAGTAACGAQALEPKVALRDAFGELASAQAGAVELSIASSADEVLAFVESADPEAEGAGIPEDDLETILSSSLDMAYDFGADREDETDDKSSIVVQIDDLVAGELRSVGETFFARADVDGLAERFPDMQPGLDEFRAGLEGGDGVTEPAPPEVVEPATAFLNGEWVSVDLGAYIEQMEEMAGEDAAGMGLSDYDSDEVRDLLGSALESGLTGVERREEDELGDHLVAKFDLRKAYTALQSGLPELFEGEEGAMIEESMPPVEEVPDKQIDVSFWLRDGELKRAELDIAQFVDEAAGSFVLRADMLSEREITAPDGAVEFDFGSLMAAGMSAYQGDAEAPLAIDEVPDAYTVATWVDMDIAYLAGEDGAPPSVSYLPEVLPGYEDVAPGLAIVAVGESVQVTVEPDVVCLTLSADGMGEQIVPGAC